MQRGVAQLCQLRGLERGLNRRSVDELIRLIRSEHLSAVTSDHIRTVAEYQPIEVDGEAFFARAFSTGKEVAGSLALALELGPRTVLTDLLSLRESMTGIAEPESA